MSGSTSHHGPLHRNIRFLTPKTNPRTPPPTRGLVLVHTAAQEETGHAQQPVRCRCQRRRRHDRRRARRRGRLDLVVGQTWGVLRKFGKSHRGTAGRRQLVGHRRPAARGAVASRPAGAGRPAYGGRQPAQCRCRGPPRRPMPPDRTNFHEHLGNSAKCVANRLTLGMLPLQRTLQRHAMPFIRDRNGLPPHHTHKTPDDPTVLRKCGGGEGVGEGGGGAYHLEPDPSWRKAE